MLFPLKTEESANQSKGCDVPAVWPVRRSFVLAEIERVFGKIIEKE